MSSASNLIQSVREHGYCVVENVIPATALDGCYYDMYRILATCGIIAPSYPHNGSWQSRALELLEDVINPARTQEVLEEQFYIRPGIINDVQSFAPYLGDSRLLEVVETLLGREARITFTTLFIHEPGTKRGPWHAGGPFNPGYAAHYPSPYPDAAMHLTMHLAFSDFNAENGGILSLPGSHRRDSNPGYAPRTHRFAPFPGETAIEAKEGSAVIMDSRFWHAIAPNPSDFPRVSVVVEYAPSEQGLPEFLSKAKSAKMSPAVFNRLPGPVQPLFRQWVGKH
jgi:ectoine hydroxylase-related dioxygenase (phytanoyl-CoA dioxygenase family)